jgi:hypothetical protein
MKKYMVADMVKDVRSDLIDRASKRFSINESESEVLVDNFPNEATWPDVEATAELYGVDITDVDDDMVEAYLSFSEEEIAYVMELGGIPEAKGEIDSSLGKVIYWFNIALGVFILTTVFDEGNPAQYPLTVSELKEIRKAESFGTYFNKNIRANPAYSDKEGSCGCIGDDPDKPKRLCNSLDFAQMPEDLKQYVTRYI